MDVQAPSISPPRARLGRPAVAAAWLLGFVPVVYLAYKGGGYDLVVRSEVGLLCWWLILLGALVGVFPRTRPTRAAWVVAALFAGLLVWTWLGVGWSSSAERSLTEAGRVAAYGGVLVLGLGLIDRTNLAGLVGGLACAIGLVCVLSVLSRLVPAWFPADPSRAFVAVARLDYPFNYADAVGEFAALGLPLLVHLAVGARTLAGRALAAAVLPLIALCVALSVSRGGALACLVGLALLFALTPRRLPTLVAGLVAAAGSAAVIGALLRRPGLRAGLDAGPGLAGERHGMLVIVLAVCLGVALVTVGLARLERRPRRAAQPGRSAPDRRMRAAGVPAAVGLVVVSVVLVVASGAPGHLWSEFKQPYVQGGGDVYSRLLTVSGSHRYQFWQAAIGAWKTSPWRGIGPGTYEFWWAQHNSLGEFVRNAHSLYFETLAELGLVGLTLICSILLITLAAGAGAARRTEPATRSLLAASLAGLGGFAAAAGFDWVWQFAAIPAVGLLLAGACLGGARRDGVSPAGGSPARGGDAGNRGRVLLGLAALPALVAVAVPLATTVAVRSSQAAARAGRYGAALGDLAGARRLEPAAASPRLQEALIYEQAGALPDAGRAIGVALARESGNWRLWLVASRIAAESGRTGQALADYRRARSLNPTSVVLRP